MFLTVFCTGFPPFYAKRANCSRRSSPSRSFLKSDRERFSQVTHDKRAMEVFTLFTIKLIALFLTKTSNLLEQPMSKFPTLIRNMLKVKASTEKKTLEPFIPQ